MLIIEKKLQIDLPSLRAKLTKPLRPEWITQKSPLRIPEVRREFYPIVCCTASRRVAGAEASEGGYIQGAGDDSEGWSQGLTPPVFWGYRERLRITPKEEVPDLIQELIKIETSKAIASTAVRILPTSLAFVSTLGMTKSPQIMQFDHAVICIEQLAENNPSHTAQNGTQTLLHLQCPSGKLGSRALRTQLVQVQSFMAAIFSKEDSPKILFACSTGRDLSVGVALAVLCLWFKDDGK